MVGKILKKPENGNLVSYQIELDFAPEYQSKVRLNKITICLSILFYS